MLQLTYNFISLNFWAWRNGEGKLFVKRVEILVVILFGIILYPDDYIEEIVCSAKYIYVICGSENICQLEWKCLKYMSVCDINFLSAFRAAIPK
jgi:hypothetical protein